MVSEGASHNASQVQTEGTVASVATPGTAAGERGGKQGSDRDGE